MFISEKKNYLYFFSYFFLFTLSLTASSQLDEKEIQSFFENQINFILTNEDSLEKASNGTEQEKKDFLKKEEVAKYGLKAFLGKKFEIPGAVESYINDCSKLENSLKSKDMFYLNRIVELFKVSYGKYNLSEKSSERLSKEDKEEVEAFIKFSESFGCNKISGNGTYKREKFFLQIKSTAEGLKKKLRVAVDFLTQKNSSFKKTGLALLSLAGIYGVYKIASLVRAYISRKGIKKII